MQHHRVSAIWSPTVSTGFSVSSAPGRSSPCRCRGCRASLPARVQQIPSRRIAPLVVRATRAGSRRISDSRGDALAAPGLTDDGQRVARRQAKETPSPRAASARACGSRCGGPAPRAAARSQRLRHAGIEPVAQPVADEVHREDGERQEQAGEEQRPGRAARDQRPVGGDHVPPGRRLLRRRRCRGRTDRPRSAPPRRRYRSPARSAVGWCSVGCGAG